MEILNLTNSLEELRTKLKNVKGEYQALVLIRNRITNDMQVVQKLRNFNGLTRANMISRMRETLWWMNESISELAICEADLIRQITGEEHKLALAVEGEQNHGKISGTL